MLAIINAAGWPIWLLLITSVIAVALIIERMLALRQSKVAPGGMLQRVLSEYKPRGDNSVLAADLEMHSPLGRVLAAGLRNMTASREVMKESIEETGRSVSHELERYLTSLGTIATLSPLLGLFGTIVGMIEIFASQTPGGSNPVMLAHGISVALYNTGFGLLIAMPSLVFWRYYRARVDGFIVEMEQQAVRLVEVVHDGREPRSTTGGTMYKK